MPATRRPGRHLQLVTDHQPAQLPTPDNIDWDNRPRRTPEEINTLHAKAEQYANRRAGEDEQHGAERERS